MQTNSIDEAYERGFREKLAAWYHSVPKPLNPKDVVKDYFRKYQEYTQGKITKEEFDAIEKAFLAADQTKKASYCEKEAQLKQMLTAMRQRAATPLVLRKPVRSTAPAPQLPAGEQSVEQLMRNMQKGPQHAQRYNSGLDNFFASAAKNRDPNVINKSIYGSLMAFSPKAGDAYKRYLEAKNRWFARMSNPLILQSDGASKPTALNRIAHKGLMAFSPQKAKAYQRHLEHRPDTYQTSRRGVKGRGYDYPVADRATSLRQDAAYADLLAKHRGIARSPHASVEKVVDNLVAVRDKQMQNQGTMLGKLNTRKLS